MFFEKPDVRYVDMCIYIDDNIYGNDCDYSLVYEYLFHIIHMLAVKRGYFKRSSDIEDFSLFAASQYYMRLTDKRQFGKDAQLESIRSILNYIRKTLFSYRNEYVKKCVPDVDVLDGDAVVSLDSDDFKCFVSSIIEPIKKCEFVDYLSDIKSVVKDVLRRTHYREGTTEWTNLYISCLLTFLNSITLKNKDIERLSSFKRETTLTAELIEGLYLKERQNGVIIYHLDPSMENYIAVLTNKIRHAISKELSATLHSHQPVCTTMKNLLMSGMYEKEVRYEYKK